jgi:hypothetical protein
VVSSAATCRVQAVKVRRWFGACVELELPRVLVALAVRPRAIVREKSRAAAPLATRQFGVTVTDRAAVARREADHAARREMTLCTTSSISRSTPFAGSMSV